MRRPLRLRCSVPGVTPNWGLAARVPQLGGYEKPVVGAPSGALRRDYTPSAPCRYGFLAGQSRHGWCQVRCGSGPPPQPQFAPEQLPQGLLEAVAVRYLVLSRDALKKPHLDMHRWRPLYDGAALASAGSMQVWVNNRAQPRAYLVPAAHAVDSAEAAWQAVAAPSFNPRRTVVLEGVAPSPHPRPPPELAPGEGTRSRPAKQSKTLLARRA